MKKIITLATICASTCFAANAEVRINGFANLVGGITGSDDSLYGYNDKVSFTDESLFAVQLAADVNDKITATAQIVARGADDYKASFDWAYMTYKATDNLNISAGRFRMPLFKYSASLDVGYSYHWVNAPRAVYDVEFNNIDGLRLDYSNYSGDWEYSTQLVLGKITIPGDTSVEIENLAMLSVEAVNDWFKARVVYGTSKATVNSTGIDQATSALSDLGFTELYNSLQYNDDTSTFLGLGLEVDKHDWFIGGEYTELETKESFSPKAMSYYITAGLRFGKYTPSLTYENYDNSDEYKFLDQVAALPEDYQAGFEGLVRGLQMGSFDKYSSVTLGLRYDLDTNIALKVDLSQYSDKLSDTDTNLLRVAANYIF